MNNTAIKKYIKLNKKLFYSPKDKDPEKYIFIEFNKWSCSHISISNCLLALKKNKNYKVIAYPENGFKYFLDNKSILNKTKYFVGQKLGINNFGIYKSFGTDEFLDIKNRLRYRKKTDKVYESLIKKIKSKNELLDLTLEKVLIGDLIYDSFLKEFKKETIDIKSKIFQNFFKTSLDYFYFWIEQFKL